MVPVVDNPALRSISIAINASRLSLQYSLPMADSIILSMARSYECLIWTQDSDFENLPGVKFFPKTKPGPTNT
ncbi:MAG: PIN domain-containing protein [Deltaproteobacteria bacterium]|nr:PIN domain-containing protein [Deltaproteobacteria bacterium]